MADAPVAPTVPSPQATVRPTDSGAYPWYVLSLLVLMYMLSSIDKTVVSIIAEPLKNEMRLSDSQLGFLSGTAFSLAFGVIVLPMGFLLDRFSRTKLLATMLALWSLLTAVSGLCRNYTELLLARFGVGAAETAAVPAGLSIIADVFPPKRRSTAVSIFYAGSSIGTLLGYVGGAWILSHYGWRAVYLLAGVPGIGIAGLIALTMRDPQRGAFDPARLEGQTKDVSILATIRTVIANAPLRYAIFANACTTGGQLSVTLWSTSYLVRIFGLTPGQAATSTGLAFGLGMIIASFIAGPVADRLSRGDFRRLTYIPAVASAVGAVAVFTMGYAPNLGIALGSMWALAIAGSFFLGNGFALVVSAADPNARSATIAVTKLVTIVCGTGMVPFLTGAISDAVAGDQSMRPAIALTGLTLVAAAFLFHRSGARAA